MYEVAETLDRAEIHNEEQRQLAKTPETTHTEIRSNRQRGKGESRDKQQRSWEGVGEEERPGAKRSETNSK